MRFRPCIDLHEGRVKQIVGSTLNSTIVIENFISERDSAWYARLFQSHNLYGGHVIMLGPDNQESALQALHAYPGGLQVGGGITAENAPFFLNEGASHVIVTSSIIQDGEIHWDNLKKLTQTVGKDKVVIDLSCKKIEENFTVMTNKWKSPTRIYINQSTLESLTPYCDEMLIHAVDVEGKNSGIQINLLEHLARLLPSLDTVSLTYAGGIHSVNDIEIINTIGENKINFTVGSALDLFGGKLKFKDLISYT